MLNQIDLSRVDLNLLTLFDVVMEERHVGRAAARLNLSASAVSHGLGRLRALLKDPLFLRNPRGVAPTARAIDLAAAVADIIARARNVRHLYALRRCLSDRGDPAGPHARLGTLHQLRDDRTSRAARHASGLAPGGERVRLRHLPGGLSLEPARTRRSPGVRPARRVPRHPGQRPDPVRAGGVLDALPPQRHQAREARRDAAQRRSGARGGRSRTLTRRANAAAARRRGDTAAPGPDASAETAAP